MHEVFLERRAERDLKRLPPEILPRILKAVASLRDDPRPPGTRKISGSDRDWRIRVGGYRVIYEIDDAARAVRVMFVRHRREAYR